VIFFSLTRSPSMNEPELEWSTNHQPSVRRPTFACWRDTAASSTTTSDLASRPIRTGLSRVETFITVSGADQQPIDGMIRLGLTAGVDVGLLLIGEHDRGLVIGKQVRAHIIGRFLG